MPDACLQLGNHENIDCETLAEGTFEVTLKLYILGVRVMSIKSQKFRKPLKEPTFCWEMARKRVYSWESAIPDGLLHFIFIFLSQWIKNI